MIYNYKIDRPLIIIYTENQFIANLLRIQRKEWETKTELNVSTNISVAYIPKYKKLPTSGTDIKSKSGILQKIS